jgi:hypothetical protein
MTGRSLLSTPPSTAPQLLPTERAAERRKIIATAEGRGLQVRGAQEPQGGERFFRRSAALAVW